MASTASAQTYTWTATATGTFDNAANWLGGAVPPAAGSTSTTLAFTVQQGHTATHNLGGPLTLNQFVFDNRGSTALTINTLSTDTTSGFVMDGAGAAIVQAGNGEITFTASTSTTAPTYVPITLNANVTVGGTGLGDVNIGSPLSGPGRLTIAGGAPTVNTRVIALTNANTANLNSFAGVTLDGGNLEIGANASVLGGSGKTLQVTANGGTLRVGSTNSGLLSNIDVAAGGTLRLLGSTSLGLAPTAMLTGGGILLNQNSGTLTIQSASTFGGVYTSDISPLGSSGTSTPGDLTLSGASGSLLNVSEFNLRAGGGLILTSSTAGNQNSNRVADTAAINLRSGILTLTGAPSAVVSESVGVISGAGYSTITVGTSGTTTAGGTARDTTLTAAGLTRVDRGTFLLRGSVLGTAQTGGGGNLAAANLVFTASPAGDLVGGGGAAGTTTVSILPYAIGGSTTSAATTTTTLLTYGPTGIRPLDTATEYATTLVSGANDNANYRLDLNPGSTVTLSAPTAINSLTINDIVSGSVAIDGAGPLTLKSGVLMVNESIATAVAVPLAFGTREAFIYTTSGDTTLSGPLTGSNGLTKSGNADLILTGDNSGLTGQLTINSGQLRVSAANNLPGTGQVVINGVAAGSSNAGFQNAGTTPVEITRDIAVNTGFANFTTAANATGSLTLSGVISGPGGVAITGSSTTAPVFMTGANTYTGPTRVTSGTLVIESDANLGNGGALYVATTSSGGLQLAGDWVTSRHLDLSTSGINTAGFDAIWNGVVTGASTLTKSGAGRLTITSSNPFDGTVTVANNGGEFRLTGNGQLNSTTYNLNNDGTMVLDYSVLPTGTPGGTGAVTIDRVSDAATVSVVNGGTLQIVGNGTRPVTERIGRLSAPTAAGVEGVLEIISSGGQLTTLRIGNLTTGTAGNGSLLIRGTGLAQTSGSASQVFIDQLNGAAVADNQLLPNVFAENLNNPGVVEGALFDAAVGIRLSGAGDFISGPTIQNAAPTNTPTNANFRVVTTTQTVDAANTIASLRFAPGATLNASSGTLTVSTGNILSEAGAGTATITGGTITAGIASGTTNNVLAFAVNSDLSVGAVLAGNAGLSKTGAGTLTLTAANTLTGTVTVSNGTLAFGPGGSLVGGATPNNLTLSAGATVNLNGINQTIGNLSGTVPTGSPVSNLQLGNAVLTLGTNTSSTFAGVISGDGRLVKAGTGTQTLSGANTFTGGVTVNAGTVAVADVARLGTGAVTVDGGTLSYTGTTASAPLAGLTVGASGGTLSASNTTAGAGLTLPATFAWNGTLTKAGSGRVFASGSLTTTQTLNVTAGTFGTDGHNLTVGNVTGTGTVDVGATGSFTPNTSTFPTSVVGTGGTLNLPAGVFTPTGTAQTISANVLGATSVFYNPSANGTLTLGGNNTFAGGVTGNAFARYVLTHANGFGTGPVALTNEVDGTNVHIMFRLGAGETTVANPIAVTPFSGLRSTFDVDSASSTTVLTGQITGGGPSDLVNNLTHTVLRLTGTNSATTGTVFKFANPTNSFQAIIEVATGNLAVADSAALGNSENPVRLANGSTTTRSGLRFDADFVGAGAFPRTVMMRSSSNINTQRFDVTLAGPVTDALIPPATVGNPPTTSTGTLTKIGTGTLTLANAANTHTGQVVVNEGSLSVVGNIAAGGTAANNVVNVNASGRLMGTGTVDRPVSVNAGGTLQGGTGGAAGTLTVGAITLDGANTLRTVVGGTGASPTFSRIAAGSNPLTFNAAGTATDLTTILLVGDGTLITDGTNTYTVTVATFTNGTPPPAANFVVAAEGFVFSGSPTLVVDGTSLVVTFTPVPEPGTVLALGAAGLGVAGLVRRRSRARCAETT